MPGPIIKAQKPSQSLIGQWLPAPLQKAADFLFDDPAEGLYPTPLAAITKGAKTAVKGLQSALPMDKASRMSRAAEQGYTTPVWHGTYKSGGPNPVPRAVEGPVQEFSEFMGPVRSSLEAGSPDFGIHVATDPATASHLLRHEFPGSRVLPLQARIQNPVSFPDMGLWRSPHNWIKRLSPALEGKQTLKSALPEGSGLPSLAPVGPHDLSDPALARHIMEQARQYIQSGVVHDPSSSVKFQQDIMDALQRGNYDAIKYRNFVEGMGEPSYLLTDPRQLRSSFAAFDPAKFGKTKDIMASTALPLAGLMAAHQVTKPKKPTQ
jgi:hypothetical protein